MRIEVLVVQLLKSFSKCQLPDYHFDPLASAPRVTGPQQMRSSGILTLLEACFFKAIESAKQLN